MNGRRHPRLLAHIVSRWSNRTEDIAVEALGFILSRSRTARKALQNVVEAVAPGVGELTDARTQVTGDDGARPDLVIHGASGRETVIVEAKFWAGLTENQPESYLERLPDDDAVSMLLFVAPDARLETLWVELRRRLRYEAGDRGDESAVGGRINGAGTGGLKCMRLGIGQRYLALTSWRAMLDGMLTSAIAAADPIDADIRQLQSLCEQQDATAFLPIKPGEFGPAIPRRTLQLNQLVDDAVVRARERGFVSTDGLRMTPQPYGYGHYIRLGNADSDRWGGAWFGVHSKLWAEFADTPLWLNFSPKNDWNVAIIPVGELREILGEEIWANTEYAIPLHLPTGVEYDAVLDSVVEQLCGLAERIGEVSSSPQE